MEKIPSSSKPERKNSFFHSLPQNLDSCLPYETIKQQKLLDFVKKHQLWPTDPGGKIWNSFAKFFRISLPYPLYTNELAQTPSKAPDQSSGNFADDNTHENPPAICQLSTFIKPTEKGILELFPSIILDAGGTNFRVAALKTDGQKIIFHKYDRHKMVSPNSEISTEKFFDNFAEKIVPILNESEFRQVHSIKFCYSFPFSISENGKAYSHPLSKEIKVKGIEDKPIDELLITAINRRLKRDQIREVVILNDTVATLLTGYYVEKEELQKHRKSLDKNANKSRLEVGNEQLPPPPFPPFPPFPHFPHITPIEMKISLTKKFKGKVKRKVKGKVKDTPQTTTLQ